MICLRGAVVHKIPPLFIDVSFSCVECNKDAVFTRYFAVTIRTAEHKADSKNGPTYMKMPICTFQPFRNTLSSFDEQQAI